MIKEKKGKIKNMEHLLVFYEFINFYDVIQVIILFKQFIFYLIKYVVYSFYIY